MKTVEIYRKPDDVDGVDWWVMQEEWPSFNQFELKTLAGDEATLEALRGMKPGATIEFRLVFQVVRRGSGG